MQAVGEDRRVLRDYWTVEQGPEGLANLQSLLERHFGGGTDPRRLYWECTQQTGEDFRAYARRKHSLARRITVEFDFFFQDLIRGTTRSVNLFAATVLLARKPRSTDHEYHFFIICPF